MKGHGLNSKTVEIVTDFYKLDEISALMPGKKDCIKVKNINGEKIDIQKRLLLATLRELYQCFKERYPELKIGFSRFYSLKPPECVYVTSSGAHTVCVCVIHQNVKLSILGKNCIFALDYT